MKSVGRAKALSAGIFAVGLVLVFVLILVVAASPRGRLNVMQGVSIASLIVLGARAWQHKRPATQTPDQAQSFRLPWLGLAAGIAAWSLSLGVQFVSDDFAHLYDAQGNSLARLKSLLLEGQLKTFMRPLGFASIFLDRAIWGQLAVGYHLTNLALHLLSVAAFYALNRALGVTRNHAMVVAGVYACMPIQVEAVAWMGARFDLLSSALTLWAVVFYLWFRESRRPSAYAVSILLYVLATFSKESSFVLPLLIVAMEFILFSPRRIWAPIGLFGAGFLSFAYRWYALHGVGGYSSDGRLAALDISVKSLEGLLLRGPTQVLTGLNWAQPPAAVVIMLGSLTATALVLLSVGTSPSRQTWRYVKLGAAWALLSMLPAHFLLLVGATLTNSRVFYLPTAGAALAVGHLVLALPRHRIREVGAAVLALLMALGVVHNLRAWPWTSQASSELLSAVVQLQPSPLPQTEFVFENLPKALRGVFFFHVALTEGVRLAYRRDDLTARRKEDPPSESPHRVNLLWTGDPNAPLQMQPAE